MIKLSASSIIEADHGCPTKTHKKYVLKKPEAATGIYGSFGRALHNTISTSIDFGQMGRPELVESQWQEDYEKIFKKEIGNLPVRGDMNKLGSELLSNWSDDMVKRGWYRMKPIMLEKYCLHQLTDNITMSGYIDIVFELEGKIYLVDWKSQTKHPNQYELDTSVQLSTYYWFLTQENIKPDYICLYMLRGNKILYTQRKQEDVDVLIQNAEHVYDRLKPEKILALPTNDNCKWCGYTQECKAYTSQISMQYDKNEDKYEVTNTIKNFLN
tara:strand:+ start:4175 stop:4984 length:810 start_codon:yes stop_codon:yes gene_type:complete